MEWLDLRRLQKFGCCFFVVVVCLFFCGFFGGVLLKESGREGKNKTASGEGTKDRKDDRVNCGEFCVWESKAESIGRRSERVRVNGCGGEGLFKSLSVTPLKWHQFFARLCEI